MSLGRGRAALHIVGIVALLARSSVAPAQTPTAVQGGSESKKACIVQHEAAQTFRQAGKLLEARDAALVCSRDDCPAVVRADCGDWLDAVSKTIPSLVIRVKHDEKDVFDVRVSIDGKLATSHLDGTPIDLNPGPHALRFEYANFDPIQQEILVLEGEKNRVIAATFVEVRPVSKEPLQKLPEREAPAPVDSYRPTPVLTYVLGGVAVVGAAGFAAFAISGQSKRKTLETSCRPVCTDNDLQPVRTQFIMADAALGIGIVSALTAGILYFTRPAKPLPASASLQRRASWPAPPIAFGFSPTASGAQFAMATEF
ncbi:MAG TPA: hypothetical protein VK550_28905 [Polyangiaceae bacterium]|nr:hypothetical protein [Polyangiaceae bacterium]